MVAEGIVRRKKGKGTGDGEFGCVMEKEAKIGTGSNGLEDDVMRGGLERKGKWMQGGGGRVDAGTDEEHGGGERK